MPRAPRFVSVCTLQLTGLRLTRGRGRVAAVCWLSRFEQSIRAAGFARAPVVGKPSETAGPMLRLALAAAQFPFGQEPDEFPRIRSRMLVWATGHFLSTP